MRNKHFVRGMRNLCAQTHRGMYFCVTDVHNCEFIREILTADLAVSRQTSDLISEMTCLGSDSILEVSSRILKLSVCLHLRRQGHGYQRGRKIERTTPIENLF